MKEKSGEHRQRLENIIDEKRCKYFVWSRERKTDVRHDNTLQIFKKAAAGWKEKHQ